MTQRMVTASLIAVLFLTATVTIAFPADDSATASASPASAPVLDTVTLKDGSVIYGEVVEMTGGLLLIKN